MAPKTAEPKTEKAAIRADIPTEMDDEIERAVALMKLRGDKALDNRSKLIRYFVERGLAELAPEIEAAQAAVRKPKK